MDRRGSLSQSTSTLGLASNHSLSHNPVMSKRPLTARLRPISAKDISMISTPPVTLPALTKIGRPLSANQRTGNDQVSAPPIKRHMAWTEERATSSNGSLPAQVHSRPSSSISPRGPSIPLKRPNSSRRPIVSSLELTPSKIEARFSINDLHQLRQRFEAADADNSAALDLEEFIAAFESLFEGEQTKQQAEDLFYRIDVNSDGTVDWDELFMYLAGQMDVEKDDDLLSDPDFEDDDLEIHATDKRVQLDCILPCTIADTPHRDQINRIRTPRANTLVTLGADGVVCIWNTSGGKLQLQQQSIYAEVSSLKGPPRGGRSMTKTVMATSKQKWVTDFAFISTYNKFVLSTGNRELIFYDASAFTKHSQITGLETVPFRIDAYCSSARCLIVFGDMDGCINIFVFQRMEEAFRRWKKYPSIFGLPSVPVDDVFTLDSVRFFRWKVHDELVNDLSYINSLHSVVSCSSDPNASIVIAKVEGSTPYERAMRELKNPRKVPARAYLPPRRHFDCDQRVFCFGRGVKAFSYSQRHKVLATGSRDHTVQLWDPYVPSRPTAFLRGHTGSIVYLHIIEDKDQLLSMCHNKMVKIWDIVSQHCLLTVQPNAHKIRSEVQALCYHPQDGYLAVATHQLALLKFTGHCNSSDEAVEPQASSFI